MQSEVTLLEHPSWKCVMFGAFFGLVVVCLDIYAEVNYYCIMRILLGDD